jgi:hypothetical protein
LEGGAFSNRHSSSGTGLGGGNGDSPYSGRGTRPSIRRGHH